MGLQRREVTFTGAVQGVGFRYTTCQAARGFEVTGFVRNRPDGNVQVVVEGEADQVERFVAGVKDRMAGYIRSVDQRTVAATGEFSDFSVRF